MTIMATLAQWGKSMTENQRTPPSGETVKLYAREEVIRQQRLLLRRWIRFAQFMSTERPRKNTRCHRDMFRPQLLQIFERLKEDTREVLQ